LAEPGKSQSTVRYVTRARPREPKAERGKRENSEKKKKGVVSVPLLTRRG